MTDKKIHKYMSGLPEDLQVKYSEFGDISPAKSGEKSGRTSVWTEIIIAVLFMAVIGTAGFCVIKFGKKNDSGLDSPSEISLSETAACTAEPTVKPTENDECTPTNSTIEYASPKPTNIPEQPYDYPEVPQYYDFYLRPELYCRNFFFTTYKEIYINVGDTLEVPVTQAIEALIPLEANTMTYSVGDNSVVSFERINEIRPNQSVYNFYITALKPGETSIRVYGYYDPTGSPYMQYLAVREPRVSIDYDIIIHVVESGGSRIIPQVSTAAPTSSEAPTQEPTKAPTPSEAPTQEPATAPTPSEAPTQEPTKAPTPSEAPTQEPTKAPTEVPTTVPTTAPTPSETPVPRYSEGLEYVLHNVSSGPDVYYVRGIGQCKDADIAIPPEYNGYSVEGIDYGAFYACTQMTSITIPNSIKTIRVGSFDYCSNLSEIKVAPDNPRFESVNNCLINKKNHYLVLGCKNSVIPDGVSGIDSNAFFGCSSLTSITIPASVETIMEVAFSECGGLTSIVVDNNNKNYKSANNCLIDKRQEKIIVGCQSGIIPDGVKVIGINAFTGFKTLNYLYIPASVETINPESFARTGNLTEIAVDPDNPRYESVNNCLIDLSTNQLILGCKNSIIPDGVKCICSGAFEECVGLTGITIPKSVEQIERLAFAGCESLTSITVDENNPKYKSINNCIINKETNTLEIGCIGSIIPDSITSIANSAFNRLLSLKAIFIPANIQTVAAGAFYRCDNLVICCASPSQPSGWNSEWNISNYPVIWNCTLFS